MNVTDDRVRVALVGQWIPRYFRGATDLDDIDPVVLTGMSAVARRVLGLQHHRASGEHTNGRELLTSARFSASTISKALRGQYAPPVRKRLPWEKQLRESAAPPRKDPPIKLAAVAGAGCAVAATAQLSAAVRGLAGLGALALGGWVGSMATADRARL